MIIINIGMLEAAAHDVAENALLEELLVRLEGALVTRCLLLLSLLTLCEIALHKLSQSQYFVNLLKIFLITTSDNLPSSAPLFKILGNQNCF